MLKHLLRAAAVSAAAAVVLASPATAVAPVVTIKPAELATGPAPRIPHISEGAVVDGAVRIPISAGRLTLLGKDGTAYLVATSNEEGTSGFRTLRVTTDSTRVLFRGVSPWEQVLSEDSRRIVVTRQEDDGPTVLKAVSSRTGSLIARKAFAAGSQVLAASGNRVLLSRYGSDRTTWWNTGTGQTRLVVRRTGYQADITADRLATFTGDVYDGGCTVVTKLSDPAVRLWRSCGEAVIAFSPDGSKQVTSHILTDGIGPSEVKVRGIGGGLRATYRAHYFTDFEWETNRALLLEAHGRHNHATVRCVLDSCTRVSGLEPNEL